MAASGGTGAAGPIAKWRLAEPLALVALGGWIASSGRFGRVANRLGLKGAPGGAPSGRDLDRARWVSALLDEVNVRRWSRGGDCVAEALAGAIMLRRRGVRSRVHTGVAGRGHGATAPRTHMWLSVGEVIVAGGKDRPAFVELTRPGLNSQTTQREA